MKKHKNSELNASFRQKVALVILSAFITILLLEISLRICGAVFETIQEYKNRLSMKQSGAYRILCVGESTTAFFRVKTPYPSFLEDLLNNAHVGVRFSVINKGAIAVGTSDIIANLRSNLDTYKPDMVIAMMGINDCGYFNYKVAPSGGSEFFFSHFRTYNFLRLLWKRCLDAPNRLPACKVGCQTIVRSDIDDSLVQQATQYQEQGRYALAEQSYQKSLSANKNNGTVHRKLGWLYQEQGEYAQAEQAFKAAINLSPKESDAYFGLALASREQDASKYPQAREAFEKAIELNPSNGQYRLMLGYYYRDQENEYMPAEENFKKAIDLLPDNYMAYRELGKTYIRRGEFQQAQTLFKEFKDKHSNGDRIYQDLIQFFEEKGEREKAQQLSQECFWRVTAKNYLKMEEIVSERKLKLVCVQYPMRNSAFLKEIFKAKKGIIFVDNERIFKEAVNSGNYNEYFIDKIFNDFGHCTEKGNKLLAENIGRSILKEVFGK